MTERRGAAPGGPAIPPAPAMSAAPAAALAVSSAVSPGGSGGGRAAVVPGAVGRAVGAGGCGAGIGIGAARRRPVPRGHITATVAVVGPGRARAVYGTVLVGGRGRRVCGARTGRVRVRLAVEELWSR